MQLEEQKLIPFQPDDLRGERLLVLAPHPDDEVIGCGGLIRHHVLEGRQVHVVVATDGTAAEAGTDDSYRDLRESETRAALAQLGVTTDPLFLRYTDRQLSVAPDLGDRLAALLSEIRPDLILVPAPIEIHPDHVALCRALIHLLERDPALVASLAPSRLAFYEVSQPIRPNTLVDITSVFDDKMTAIVTHHSQTALRDYGAFAEGLARYRSMTLPAVVLHAEGYWVIDTSEAAIHGWTALARRMAPTAVEVIEDLPPVTVIIRTKNRLALLEEAIASVLASSVPANIVVVNDGGESPATALVPFGARVRLVDEPVSRGRSQAMNTGVHAAETNFIAFLDDDDLFYSDHLATLARALKETGAAAVYSDCVSTRWSTGADGRWAATGRSRAFGEDFDRDLLLFDNYIPLPAVMTTKAAYLRAGGFDPAFDLFEDWDFLIRLSAHGTFRRVPRITCEIRHIAAIGSAMLENPASSQGFAAAKRQVWAKHGVTLEHPAFLRWTEHLKNRSREARAELHELSGRAARLELEITRLDRERSYSEREAAVATALLAQRDESLRDAETARDKAIAQNGWFESQLQVTHARIGELTGHLQHANQACEHERAAVATLSAELDRVHGDLEAFRTAADDRAIALNGAFAEIERLTAALRAIEQSRTWKLHNYLLRMRGGS